MTNLLPGTDFLINDSSFGNLTGPVPQAGGQTLSYDDYTGNLNESASPLEAGNSAITNALGMFNTTGSGLSGTGITGSYGSSAPGTQTSGQGTPATTGATPSNSAPLSGAQSVAFESNIFIRAIVVISGFIFLGIGLWMLKPSVIQSVRRNI